MASKNFNKEESLSPSKRIPSSHGNSSPSKNIIDFYSSQVRLVESKCDQKDRELTTWKTRCSALEQQIGDTALESAKAQERAAQEEARALTAERALAASKAEHHHTLNELERAHKIIIDLEKAVTSQGVRLKENEQEIYDLQRKWKATEQLRVAQLEEKDIAQRQAVDSVKSTSDIKEGQLRVEIEQQHTLIQRYLSKIKELENALSRTQTSEKNAQLEVTRLQGQIVDLHRNISDLQIKQERERDLLQQRFDEDLARKKQVFDSEQNRLQVVIEGLKLEIADLKRANDFKENSNISLQKNLVDAERLLRIEAQEKDALRREVELRAIEKQIEGHRSRWQIEETVNTNQARREDILRRGTTATSKERIERTERERELERLRKEELDLKRQLELTTAINDARIVRDLAAISPSKGDTQGQRKSVSPSRKNVSFSPVRSEIRY